MNATVSLAMIVRDVEKTLDRCLEGFKQCVDEIIIVDTGSVDNTVEIAKKYTDKIYHFEWIDDFSAARNFSFEKCIKEMIYWSDGDDYILPADIKKINEYDFTGKDMVLCNYIYSHDEFGANKSVVPRERFFRRSLGLKWEGAIHEVVPLQGKYYVTDIETHHDKQQGTSERNLAILERIVEKNPSPRNLYYLGKEYIDFNRIDDAINNLLKFLDCRGTFWENVFQAHYKLANCYLIKKNDEKFIFHIFESIKMEDRQAEPFYFLGLYYMNKQNWQRAIRWFEVCIQMERPKDLLSPYQPEYYTWLPALNACVCYNSIGETQKAYDRNKKVLKYRSKDLRAVENERILRDALKRESGQKDGKGKKLNLGSGGKPMEGYVSVDIFESPNVDEIFDMGEIPYQDGTIGGIYSEHALEHVSFKRSEEVIKEWFRVLQPGAQLELYMPDFEKCCEAYLKAPLEDSFFMRTRAWFKATVYGIQESQGGEPDEAQIHMCGYSKEEIRVVLERNGFIIKSVENYGGPGQKKDYCTPSMAIMASKPEGWRDTATSEVKKEQVEFRETFDTVKLKIGWISNENWIAAQTRIRVLRVNKWLQEHGYDSSLATYADIIEKNYDIAIVGKMFNEENYQGIMRLKQHNKLIYCDLCEDVINWAWVNEILAICDKVICCSDALAEKVKPINQNIVVLEDAYETD
jgi:glycosyltransferase involved in cell wall biosynthesis